MALVEARGRGAPQWVRVPQTKTTVPPECILSSTGIQPESGDHPLESLLPGDR